MEGITYSQYDCLNLMKDAGISSEKVVLFGGGARSGLWRKITADIFGTSIVTLNVEEGPSYGAAIIAGVGAGLYPSVRKACSSILKEVTDTEPDAETNARYSRYYAVYRSLYKDLKGDFERISGI
jgi:xylulokinase